MKNLKTKTQAEIKGGNGERYALIRETNDGVFTVGGFFEWSRVEGFWTTTTQGTQMFVPVN